MDSTMVTKNIHSPSTLGLPYWQLSTLVIFFYITCVITLFIATLARCCEYISIHNSTTHVSPPLPPFSVGRVDVNCLTPCSRVNSSLSSNCHGNISLVIHPGDKHALACNKPIHQVWLLLSMYVHFTYNLDLPYGLWLYWVVCALLLFYSIWIWFWGACSWNTHTPFELFKNKFPIDVDLSIWSIVLEHS